MKAVTLLACTTLEEKKEIIADFITENSSEIAYCIEHKDREILERVIRVWLQSETELSADNRSNQPQEGE